MIVFRLTKQKYQNDLSGIGAQLSGGRWNTKGNRLVYTSQNRALCTAEVAVHVPLGIVPKDYVLQTIKLPKCEILEIKLSQLPKNWKAFPHIQATKKFGDSFIQQNKYLVLKVPSAIVPDEYNFLINPLHQLMAEVKITDIIPFQFDERLFQ